MRITRAVPSVVRSLLYRFLKVRRRSVSLRRGCGARKSLDRHPPGAADAVAGLGLCKRVAQSNLNRRARPTRGATDDLPSSGSRDTRDTRAASCVHAACDTRATLSPVVEISSGTARPSSREETVPSVRAREKGR